MTADITIGTTSIGIMPIPADSSLPRRQREKAAVAELLQRMLGHEANLSHTSEGAPLLPDYHISISHSRDLAVVALDAVRPVGIDAEEMRPQLQRIKERFLSPQELQSFTTPRQLLTAWTIKEAVYKIAGAVAVEFRKAITIAPDMRSAHCLGRLYAIHTFDHGDTRISLAYKRTREQSGYQSEQRFSDRFSFPVNP